MKFNLIEGLGDPGEHWRQDMIGVLADWREAIQAAGYDPDAVELRDFDHVSSNANCHQYLMRDPDSGQQFVLARQDTNTFEIGDPFIFECDDWEL